MTRSRWIATSAALLALGLALGACTSDPASADEADTTRIGSDADVGVGTDLFSDIRADLPGSDAWDDLADAGVPDVHGGDADDRDGDVDGSEPDSGDDPDVPSVPDADPDVAVVPDASALPDILVVPDIVVPDVVVPDVGVPDVVVVPDIEDEPDAPVEECERGRCDIDGRCWDRGESPERRPCWVCLPDRSSTEWSVRDGAEACADGNECTTDMCSRETGVCVNRDNRDFCDDGIECTTGDRCLAGTCVGDSAECVCEPGFGDPASRATFFAIGTSGTPGQGLDVDGDASTCAPVPSCSDGVDNALSVIASFVNDSIDEAIGSGSLNLLFELRDWGERSFTVAFHGGVLAADDRSCDQDEEYCRYDVYEAGLDGACMPVVTLAGRRDRGTLIAGGDDAVVPLLIPLGSGPDDVLAITLRRARMEAEFTETDSGAVRLDGIIAGAVRRTELIAALEAVPPEALPIELPALLALLDFLLVSDIDTDGDGVADAASVGFVLETIAAELAGVR